MSSSTDPPRSNTSVVSEEADHVLKIDGYSRIMDTKDDRLCIVSCMFPAGGHTWQILCYPMGGQGSENVNFIALFLVLCDTVVNEAVTAQATLTVLDQDGKPSYSRTTAEVNLSDPGSFCGFYKFMRRRDLEESSELLVRDDCIALGVHVRVLDEAPSTTTSDMHQHHLFDLLSKSKGTEDVEFRVEGNTFVAHRSVLRARSPVFRAQVPQLPSARKETDTGVVVQITLDDIEPRVFKALLTFIYTDACPAEMDDFVMTQSLLAAADTYSVQRLKLMCEDRLCGCISTGSVSTLLALAEKHKCPGLKEACFDFLASKTVLFAVVKTKEYEHLARSCPAITTELIYNVLNRKRADTAGWSQEMQVSVMKM